jgi:hypothetical protein
VPFLHVTTHLKDRPHENLFKEKGFGGFPSLAFLDAEGNVLTVQRDRSVAAFDKTLAALTASDDLRQRIAKGAKGLEFDLFIAEWTLGKFDFETVKERAGSFKNLKPAQKEQLAQIVLDAEVLQLIAGARSETGFNAAAKRFRAILDAGKRMPSADVETDFWSVLMSQAEKDPVDAALYERGLKEMERIFGQDPKRATMLNRMRTRLEELRKGAS